MMSRFGNSSVILAALKWPTRREERTGWSRIIVKEFPPDIPAIRIWFTYDDDKVYIEGVDLLSEFL